MLKGLRQRQNQHSCRPTWCFTVVTPQDMRLAEERPFAASVFTSLSAMMFSTDADDHHVFLLDVTFHSCLGIWLPYKNAMVLCVSVCNVDSWIVVLLEGSDGVDLEGHCGRQAQVVPTSGPA